MAHPSVSPSSEGLQRPAIVRERFAGLPGTFARIPRFCSVRPRSPGLVTPRASASTEAPQGLVHVAPLERKAGEDVERLAGQACHRSPARSRDSGWRARWRCHAHSAGGAARPGAAGPPTRSRGRHSRRRPPRRHRSRRTLRRSHLTARGTRLLQDAAAPRCPGDHGAAEGSAASELKPYQATAYREKCRMSPVTVLVFRLSSEGITRGY